MVNDLPFSMRNREVLSLVNKKLFAKQQFRFTELKTETFSIGSPENITWLTLKSLTKPLNRDLLTEMPHQYQNLEYARHL